MGERKDVTYLLDNAKNLTSKDIFLFDIPRCMFETSYSVFESIKNGRITSTKYNNKEVYLKTPNTVIVFSNHYPTKSQLSEDRWEIYAIEDNQLVKK